MTREEKFNWMAIYCAKNNLALTVEGECGFGRECVGVLSGDTYPDYEWSDARYNRIDDNDEVWTPKDAYHKHPCVAVLGRGEEAEDQLYQWLKWFDDNGFKHEIVDMVQDVPFSVAEIIMGKNEHHRMIKPK